MGIGRKRAREIRAAEASLKEKLGKSWDEELKKSPGSVMPDGLTADEKTILLKFRRKELLRRQQKTYQKPIKRRQPKTRHYSFTADEQEIISGMKQRIADHKVYQWADVLNGMETGLFNKTEKDLLFKLISNLNVKPQRQPNNGEFNLDQEPLNLK